MKKFLLALLTIFVMAGSAFAATQILEDGGNKGIVDKLHVRDAGTIVTVSGNQATFDFEDVGPAQGSLSVGTEASNEIAVTVTVQDSGSNTQAEDRTLLWWLSDTAGAATTATAPDIDLTVTGGVVVKELTTNVAGLITTGSDGIAVITVGDDDADNDWYLNVSVDGRVYSSAVINHAA